MKRKQLDNSYTECELVCPVCSKRFKTLRYLKQHLQVHDEKRQCEICGEVFSFDNNLKRHQKDVHGIQTARRTNTFSCDVCNKKFTTKCSLDHHKFKVHRRATAEQTFICRHCDNVCTNYRQLVRHIEQEHPLNQRGGRQRTRSKSLDERENRVVSNESETRRNQHFDESETRRNQHDTHRNRDVNSALENNVQNRNIYPRQNEKYDVLTFFANVKEEIMSVLRLRARDLDGIKWNLCVQVEMQRDDGQDAVITLPYFRSRTYHVLSLEDMHESLVNEALQLMHASLEKYLREGSGFFVKRVLKLEIHTVVYKPITGSSYIPLPKTLHKTRSVLNIRNDDEKCFLYSVLASLHPVELFADSAEIYRPYANDLNMTGIRFPVALSDIRRFEKQNDEISVNVFTFDHECIVPLRITSHPNRIHHVNLLLLKNEETTHYCLITDLNKFLYRTKTHKNKTYFCPYCLHGFIREDLLTNHQTHCSVHGAQKVELPSLEKAVLKFKDFEKTLKVPFVIYADFETINVKLHTCAPNPEWSATTPSSKLEVCGYGYKVICEDDRFTKPTVVYRGPNASTKLIEKLLEEQARIETILSKVEPMKLRKEHENMINDATHCCLCKKKFTLYDRNYKRIVRHHNHLTGEIIGAACNECNVNCRQSKFTCVIFHNLKNFDAHILCESLGQFKEHRLKCIAQNSERYVSFSLGGLRFLDSYQFLPSSLETLVDNLKQDGLDAFHHTLSEFKDRDHAELLTRKGVYPYDYMDSFERFEEQVLPDFGDFYSSIKKENISEVDYAHAQTVFDKFNMKSLGEFHDLYLQTDVVLLSDVFESFRNVCLKQYELDPCHFYTSPGLSWASLLKTTGIELQLLTDIDQMLMIEAGIRGGVSQISNRYKKANNPHLEDYNPSQPTSYLQYLDANNLYGWAMVQPLPVGEFRFLNDIEGFDVMNIPENGEIGYIVEASLHYPSRLHDLHNCLPLAPERKAVSDDQLSSYAKHLLRKLYGLKENDPLPHRGRVEKLLATLEDKERYVLHYRNLQLYVRLGMEIKGIHRVLQFRQAAWMAPYIKKNTEMRQKAKTTFEKNFFKLLNVSVFGKTMENVRKHKDIELVHRTDRLVKLAAKPTYKHTVIFNQDLAAVELLRSKVELSKPSYCGMCILDLSKYLMYDFWYNYIKRRYGDSAQLQMTDTDSLLFYCQTDNIYNDMQLSLDLFDTSDFPKEHFLHSNANKKVLGKMKDETNGRPISEFVGLRSKMYSFVCDRKEEKRAKGIAKATVKKDIKHKHYKDTLFDETKMVSSMTCLRSHRHEVFCETLQKTSLTAYDDKRSLRNNIESYAYGHYKIAESDQNNTNNDVIQSHQVDLQHVDVVEELSFVIGDFKITPCM